jgi:hypothetical protein
MKYGCVARAVKRIKRKLHLAKCPTPQEKCDALGKHESKLKHRINPYKYVKQLDLIGGPYPLRAYSYTSVWLRGYKDGLIYHFCTEVYRKFEILGTRNARRIVQEKLCDTQ